MLITYKLNPEVPYRGAYNTFSAIQWFIIGAALVHMFGWLYGLISIVAAAMFLQYITHFTLGLVYSKVFSNPIVPLAIFVIMFWVNTVVTAALFM
jgi:hypothetical protein